MKLGMPKPVKNQSQQYMGGGSEISGASSSYDSRRIRKYCDCGMVAPLKTAWRNENPGRRFYRCGLFQIQGRKGCDFFDWHDDANNDCEKKIIRALLRKVDELKKSESELKKREKLLGFFLVLSWVIVMVLGFAIVRRG